MDEKPLSFIITPFVLMIVSALLTALYYHQFHPGSVLQTNGPKYRPDDKKSALCICKTLFCCQMQDWEIPDIAYKRMTPSTSMKSLHDQNGHVEMLENTFVNDDLNPV